MKFLHLLKTQWRLSAKHKNYKCMIVINETASESTPQSGPSPQWAEAASLVQVLTQLHEWEARREALLTSMSGRHLYFSVAGRMVASGRGPTVKEAVTAWHITDRAIRARLADMLDKGYFSVEPLPGDRRARALIPLEPYEQLLLEHAAEFKRLMSQQFMLIERNGAANF